MTATAFKQLIELAFAPKNPKLYPTSPEEVYLELAQEEKAFRKKPTKAVPVSLSFAFERVRLGVAAAIIKVFTQISENEDSQQILRLLLRALKAKDIAEIDAIMHKEMEVFENLFLELFEDETRELVLDLFEQALQAESKEDLDAVIEEAVMLLDQEQI